ncbi:MAG: cell division protein FtsB, partial [Betaproteobacteria bacterium]|nr:cell division protein FtsB [Betaproteobacteria bacterium]
MTARHFSYLLIGLLLLVQYPLWIGKGGWLRVWELDRQLQIQRAENQRLVQRNAALEADVRDLQVGTVSIEERARYELGMVKSGEMFVQITEASDAKSHEIRTVGLAYQSASQSSAPK